MAIFKRALTDQEFWSLLAAFPQIHCVENFDISSKEFECNISFFYKHMGRFAIKQSWGITNRQETLNAIAHLLNEGHRSRLTFEKAPKRLLEMKDSAEKKYNFEVDLYAWDLVRSINLSFSTWFFDYLEKEESWNFTVYAGALLRQHYNSWTEISISYVMGKMLWGEIDEDSIELLAEIIDIVDNNLSPVNALDFQSVPFDVERMKMRITDTASS